MKYILFIGSRRILMLSARHTSWSIYGKADKGSRAGVYRVHIAAPAPAPAPAHPCSASASGGGGES